MSQSTGALARNGLRNYSEASPSAGASPSGASPSAASPSGASSPSPTTSVSVSISSSASTSRRGAVIVATTASGSSRSVTVAGAVMSAIVTVAAGAGGVQRGAQFARVEVEGDRVVAAGVEDAGHAALAAQAADGPGARGLARRGVQASGLAGHYGRRW